jgi:FSR family fosmidomycin resistance protein-like MFS transporter
MSGYRGDNGLRDGQTVLSLAVYGLGHAIIDALCAGILFTLWGDITLDRLQVGGYFVLYNLLAFGAQPLLGWCVDWWRRPRTVAVLGALITVLAVLGFERYPSSAVWLAGLGNAIYHLGAGSICLGLTPGRAMAAGWFVAPGALGLFAGTHLAQTGAFVAWPFLVLLIAVLATAAALPLPAALREPTERPRIPPPVWLPVVFLLICIGARSLVGFAVDLPWKTGWVWGLGLVGSVALGKAMGGVAADRLGWGRVTVGALAVAAPLLAFGAANPGPALAGMFLLNLTMPVTLAATANLLPGRPALAFGLTCFALELGAWPVRQAWDGAAVLSCPWAVFAITVGAAGALYGGLKLAFRRWPSGFVHVHE